RLFKVGNAGENRGYLLEVQFGRIRQEPRHRGLAGAWRSPEHQRAQRTRRQHPRQLAIRPQDVILSDDSSERPRAQHVRQRMLRVPRRPRRGEQRGTSAWALRAHPPSVTLICWPPRIIVIRQSREGSRVARSRSAVLDIFWLFTATMMSPFWNPTLA